MAYSQTSNQFFGVRLLVLVVGIACIFSVLAFRLHYLQVIRGVHYRDVSENQRTREIRTMARRGNVFDREDRLLVGNRPSFNIAVLREDVRDVDRVVERLAALSGRDAHDLEAELQGASRQNPFEPRIVLADISREELARIRVNGYDLPGVIVNVRPQRIYPYHQLAAQVVGYAREITREQLERIPRKRGQKSYRPGDIIGQDGLEKGWEAELSGRSGYIQVEVDAVGKRRGELGIVDSTPGRDLYLTLDVDLQSVSERLLENEKGAIVALDPRTGDILALASAPSYDANLFSGTIPSEDWQLLNSPKLRPLNNRAVAAMYSPGSTFKLFMAVAGLAEEKITPETVFECPGYYLFAGRRYHCHKRSGHGKVKLREAVVSSCNSYFYQLGQLLGVDTIEKYSRLFGFGALSGISVPGESKGIVPSRKWKLETFGERWYAGETLSVSIGQGFLTVTPLQLALGVSALVNGGTLYRPRLVRKVVSADATLVERFEPEVRDELMMNKYALDLVRDYAIAAVEDKAGTGSRARIEGITVGGKTGTSQVFSLGKESDLKEHQDHAWFVAFAPAENPAIVVAVIVEHGGGGGATAAPIAKQVMERFFEKQGHFDAPDEQPTENLQQAKRDERERGRT